MDGALTPETLKELRFARVRHGYRVEDVDDVLARVADDLAALRAEAAALRRRVAELEAERAEQPEQRAHHVLTAASSLAEAVVAEATREAEAVAAERDRRVASTAGALLEGIEACTQALGLVDALREELRAAGAAFRPLVEGSPDVPAEPPPRRAPPRSPVRAPASPALADGPS